VYNSHEGARDYTKMNVVLPYSQFGFRTRHSTCHQMVRLTNKVSSGFQERSLTGTLLLDIDRAFDTVWHDALIYKIEAHQVVLDW
jgi:hypothetical protein